MPLRKSRITPCLRPWLLFEYLQLLVSPECGES